MKVYKARARKCSNCASSVISAETGDTKRYNCVTGEMVSASDLPEPCWQRRFPTVGKEILAAIHPVRLNDAGDQRRAQKKLELAEALATLAETGKLNEESVTSLESQFGARMVGSIRAKILGDGIIASVLKSHRKAQARDYLREYRKRQAATNKEKREAAQSKKIRAPLTSEEFLKAVDLWANAYRAREERKEKYNHPYAKKTVKRVIQDAKRFCAYLEMEGLSRLVDVSQQHIDGYLEATSREAAQKAYTFLRFCTSRFRIPSSFSRPINRKKLIAPRIVQPEKFEKVLEDARNSPSSEVTLALYLIAIYGQTLAAVSCLTKDHIQATEDGYQIKFYEVWLPLDDETIDVLMVHLRNREKRELEFQNLAESKNLFWSTYEMLAYQIKLCTNVLIKDLRLTAVVNILKTGFTDRHSLEKTLGISQVSIATMERICGWDFQSAVSDEAAQLRRDLIDGKLHDR